MANIRVLSPKIEEYLLVVSIPWNAPSIIIMRNQTIGEAEEFFIRKRDKESNHEQKVEFDRARALLHYASFCNAKLMEIRNVSKKLVFEFGFRSLDAMDKFCDTMPTAVSGATMK